MWTRIRESFDNGTKQLQWYASLLSDRVRVELTIFKLYGALEKLERKKGVIMKSLGEEVVNLSTQPVTDVYEQKAIKEAIREIQDLDRQIDEIKKEASDVSSLES